LYEGFKTDPASALSGFLFFLDAPSRSKPRFFTEQEHALAQSRIAEFTAPPQLKLTGDIFKRVFSRWHWYVLVIHWTLMDQNFAPQGTPFSLYLKAHSDLYSVVRINTLPTIATAVGVVTALTCGVVADKTGRFWVPSVAVTLPVIAALGILVAWDVGEKTRVAGYIMTGFESGE
jgi:ACS family pantothenate transporter-like MFS transporter